MPSAEVPTASPAGRSWLFPLLALVLCLTVAWGFWRTYYTPLLSGSTHKHFIIHAHAAVFSTWMLLFLAQSSLVALRRPDLHRRLGPALMLFGAVVFATGVFAGVGMPAAHVADGGIPVERAALVVLYNLVDMLGFAGFLAAAYLLQHRTEWHRRLVICAVLALTGAAVGRVLPAGSFPYFAVWLLPLALVVAADLLQRSVHPSTFIAAPVFALIASKVAILSGSALAVAVGAALLRPFI